MTDINRMREAIRDLPRWQTYELIAKETGLTHAWVRNFMLDREGAQYRPHHIERLASFLGINNEPSV